jgi:tetratricopeptide (TPR) repeat protein
MVATALLLGGAPLWGDVAGPGAAQAQDWEIRKKPKSPPPSSGSRRPTGPRKPAAKAPTERELEQALRQLEADPTDRGALDAALRDAPPDLGASDIARLARGRAEAAQTERAWLVVAMVELAARNGEPALQAVERAQTLAPDSAMAYAVRAEVEAALGRLAPATAAAERAAELWPPGYRKIEALLRAAALALDAGDAARADQTLDRLVGAPPDPRALVDAARLLADRGQFERSAARWEAASALGGLPARVAALLELSGVREALGQADAALDAVARARALAAQASGLSREVEERWVELHRRQGKLDAVIASLEATSGQNAQAQLELGALYEEVGREDAAAAAYRKALALAPKLLDARRALVSLLERSGRREELEAELVALQKLEPRNPDPSFALAGLFHARGDKARALALVSQIEKAHPRDAQVQVKVADHYLLFGAEAPVVEGVFRRLRSLEPREEAHVLNLGEVYFNAGDTQRAIATWSELPSVLGDRAEGHFRIATTGVAHSLTALAMDNFEAALRLAPERVDVRQAFGDFLLQIARYEPALAQWRSVLEYCRADRECALGARDKIVEIWDRAGRLAGEMKRLQGLVAATPPELGPGLLLGRAHIRQSQLPEAAAVYERLAEAYPQDAELLLALEVAYAQANERTKAADVARRLAALEPARRSEHLARVADYELEQGGDASLTAEQLVQLRPADPGARARLGDVYWQLGRVADAEREYREAIRLGAREADPWLRLLQLYRDSGRLQDELELSERALEAPHLAGAAVRLGRRYVLVAARLGQLERAETTLLKLSSGGQQAQVYRQLLVDVLERRVTQLAGAAALPGEQGAAAARALQLTASRSSRFLLAALDADDVAVRLSAIEILKDLRYQGAVPALARLAESRDPELQLKSVVALAHIGGQGGVPAIERLTRGEQVLQRLVGIWALGAIGGPDAKRALEDALPRLGHPVEQGFAALALGMTREPGVVPRLREGILSPNRAVHIGAAIGLGAQSSTEGLADVATLVQSAFPEERAVALWALGRSGSPLAVGKLVRHLLTQGGSEVDVATWALEQLGSGSQPSGETLRATYLDLVSFHRPEAGLRRNYADIALEVPSGSPEIALRVLERLGELIAREVAAILREPSVRGMALQSLAPAEPGAGLRLGRLGDACSDDDCAKVSAALAQALAPLTESIAVVAAAGSDPAAQSAALRVLALVGVRTPAAAVGAVRAALGAESVHVRAAALHAAASLRLTELAGLVEGQLRAEPSDWQLRAEALRAGAALGVSGVERLARAALSDRFASVRLAAIDALVLLDAKSSAAELVGRLDVEDTMVQKAILSALSQLRTTETLPALERFRLRAPLEMVPLVERAIAGADRS